MTILVLCVVAGIATLYLLPGRREKSIRVIGGVVLMGVGLIFTALVLRWSFGQAAGTGVGPYFWIFSAIALFGAFRVVTHTQPVYSALYFVLTVFATAGLFLLLEAEFMAAALILICFRDHACRRSDGSIGFLGSGSADGLGRARCRQSRTAGNRRHRLHADGPASVHHFR
jgi:hypothetical protein